MKAQILMLREMGRTYNEIADVYCVKPSVIYNYINDKTHLVPNDYITIAEYMKEYGHNKDVVYWHIRAGNIQHMKVNNRLYISIDTKITKRGRGITSDMIDMIVQMLNYTELSYRAIGKIVGCSGQTVKNYKDMLC